MIHLTGDDLAWLAETHGVDVQGCAVAILHGNEDCPERVDVFAVDDYRCIPTVWIRCAESGNLERRTALNQGSKP